MRLNWCSSNSNALWKTCVMTLSGNGARARGGLLVTRNALNVAWFLGTNSAPSRACLADDNSPRETNISALRDRLSKLSCFRRLALLRALAALSSHNSLPAIRLIHSPRLNASNRAMSLDFAILPPPGGRCKSIRGSNNNNFQPLSSSTSPLFRTISFNATFKALGDALHHGGPLPKLVASIDLVH